MVTDHSADAAVERFAAARRDILTQLLHDLPAITDVADLLAAVRARRQLPREGITRSGIQYIVHGAGCRMTASGGREVDVDLIPDPRDGQQVEAFDAWRVRWSLDGAAEQDFSDAQIASGCTRLTAEGARRVVIEGRWYVLADRPENG